MKLKLSYIILLSLSYGVGLGDTLELAGERTSVTSQSPKSQLLGVRRFDAVGDQLVTFNGAGEKRHTNYNVDGSPNTTVDLLGQEQQYHYHDNGLLESSTVLGDDSLSIQYEYDSTTQRLLKATQGENTHQFDYYAGGHTKKSMYQNTLGQYGLEYVYDRHTGDLLTMTDNEGNQKKYLYNQNGVAKLVYQNNMGDTLFKVNYIYDGYGRLIELRRQQGHNSYYEYDEYNRVKAIYIGSSKLKPALVYHYEYNLSGNISEQSIESFVPGKQSTVSYKYHYNNKNALSVFEVDQSASDLSGNNTDLYPRNTFGSIITKQEFDYDLNQNITKTTTTFLDETKDVATYAYQSEQGHPDRLSKISHSGNYKYIQALQSESDYRYNKNGQPLEDDRKGSYTYNARNQLIKYESNSKAYPQVVTDYTYNVHGILNSNQATFTKDKQSASKASEPVYYYYGHGGLVKQQQGKTTSNYISGFANVVTSETNQGQSSTNIEQLYAVKQGNIAATSKAGSADGTTLNHVYVYSPYGMQSDVLNPVSGKKTVAETLEPMDIKDNHFGYTGQQFDTSVGKIQMGNWRSMDPATGRFIQADTLDVFSGKGTPNHYAYASMNPMAYTDPTGHFSWLSVLGGIADAVEGISTMGLETLVANAATNMAFSNAAHHHKITHGGGKAFGLNVAASAVSEGINDATTLATAGASTVATSTAVNVGVGIVASGAAGFTSSLSSQGITTGKVNYEQAGVSAGVSAGMAAATVAVGAGVGKAAASFSSTGDYHYDQNEIVYAALKNQEGIYDSVKEADQLYAGVNFIKELYSEQNEFMMVMHDTDLGIKVLKDYKYGFFVSGHGSRLGRFWAGDVKLYADTLANVVLGAMKARLGPEAITGRTFICLSSCYAGESGMAQGLADRTGMDVYAKEEGMAMTYTGKGFKLYKSRMRYDDFDMAD